MALTGMAPFSSYSFEKFTLDELPVQRDTWIMDEIYMGEWEDVWLKSIGGDEHASPYEVGYITQVHIANVTAAGAEISWYPNTHDRFHEVKTFLPREAFVAAALAYQYEKRVSVFVKSDWLRKLHLQSNSIFAMIDAVDMTAAIKSGAISHEKVIALRDRLDEFAGLHPDISFISFADSLLIKTNWTAGMVHTGVKYDYRPEALLYLFQELQVLYQDALGLEIYGVFAQGTNEYYDDPLLHISASKNHISLNSLGLPFAQIQIIEGTARLAIRAGTHGRAEIYMDEDLFTSLQFDDYNVKTGWANASYKQKLTSKPGNYYFGDWADFVKCLRKP